MFLMTLVVIHFYPKLEMVWCPPPQQCLEHYRMN